MAKIFTVRLQHFWSELRTRRSDVPDYIHGTPCEACAKSGENHLIARLESVLVFVDAQRYGGSTGVAVFLYVDKYLRVVDTGTFGHGLYDTQVGLMSTNQSTDSMVRPLRWATSIELVSMSVTACL